jgi:hypothetical protein
VKRKRETEEYICRLPHEFPFVHAGVSSSAWDPLGDLLPFHCWPSLQITNSGRARTRCLSGCADTSALSSPSPARSCPVTTQRYNHVTDDLPIANGPEPRNGLEARRDGRRPWRGIDEAAAAAAASSTSGLVSKWRPKGRVMDRKWCSLQMLFLLLVLMLYTLWLFAGFGASGLVCGRGWDGILILG